MLLVILQLRKSGISFCNYAFVLVRFKLVPNLKSKKSTCPHANKIFAFRILQGASLLREQLISSEG